VTEIAVAQQFVM